MDSLQARILQIALEIPEYVGYNAKERRRDVDRQLRRRLAARYDEQRTRLARLQQRAGMEFVVQVESLDQKLLRLIAQLTTAPRGYAGWFDAAQIDDADLDQLTKFDSDLTGGVERLKTTLNQLGDAIKSKTNVLDAIDACADTLDSLNAEFDERDEFVAQGKKPTVEPPTIARPSPLGALEAKKIPSRDFTALASLKLRDALTFERTDYIVAGKMTFNASGETFFAFLIQDGGRKQWLRVGPETQVAWCDEIALAVSAPLPESLEHDQQSFARDLAGKASVNVEGAGGSRRGNVIFARYAGNLGSVLWVEDFGADERAMLGRIIAIDEVKIFKRN